MADPTPDQIEAARAIVAAADAKAARDRQAQLEVRYAPLVALVNSAALAEVREGIRTVLPTMRNDEDDMIYNHLQPLGAIIDRLRQCVSELPVAAAAGGGAP